jgi:hypothetical protein
MPLIPNGIVAFAGALQDIPSGWSLCDGQNGTPNLRNKFIVGAGDLYNVNTTGGRKDAVLVSHNHAGSVTNTTGSHNHFIPLWSGSGSGTGLTFGSSAARGVGTSSAGDHTHTVESVSTVGTADVSNANLPPYYALAFIKQV